MREIRKILSGQEMQRKQGSKSVFTELGGKLTRNSRRIHGQGTERAYKKL